jgi:hypothetical protein
MRESRGTDARFDHNAEGLNLPVDGGRRDAQPTSCPDSVPTCLDEGLGDGVALERFPVAEDPPTGGVTFRGQVLNANVTGPPAGEDAADHPFQLRDVAGPWARSNVWCASEVQVGGRLGACRSMSAGTRSRMSSM